MRTLAIKDDVYDKLVSIKGRNESFSQLFERLLARKGERRRQVTNDIKAIRDKDRSNWSGSEEVIKWRDAR